MELWVKSGANKKEFPLNTVLHTVREAVKYRVLYQNPQDNNGTIVKLTDEELNMQLARAQVAERLASSRALDPYLSIRPSGGASASMAVSSSVSASQSHASIASASSSQKPVQVGCLLFSKDSSGASISDAERGVREESFSKAQEAAVFSKTLEKSPGQGRVEVRIKFPKSEEIITCVFGCEDFIGKHDTYTAQSLSLYVGKPIYDLVSDGLLTPKDIPILMNIKDIQILAEFKITQKAGFQIYGTKKGGKNKSEWGKDKANLFENFIKQNYPSLLSSAPSLTSTSATS
jgi:hypothetical protein